MIDGLTFTPEQVEAVVALPQASMGLFPYDTYTLELTGAQLAELERLVVTYTEALAQYNDLNAGLQSTLDTLNGAWAILANARPAKPLSANRAYRHI